jgi:hypothetical protein
VKRFLKWLRTFIFAWSVLLSILGTVAVGGYYLLKFGDRAIGPWLFSAQPSLDSIDPFERADAARLALKKYGGGK